jgi:hypothetical protein
MAMNPVKILAVFAQNLPGQSARITKILADVGVNIHWTTVENSGSFGVVKFLVADRDKAEKALRAAGLMISSLEVLAVSTENKAGALHAVVDCLAKEGMNLDNVSGFVSRSQAIVLVETHATEKARGILVDKGFHVMSEEELLAV